MKDRETYLLVRDLRNALAAAMRVLVSIETSREVRTDCVDAFLAETRRLGIKDGIGVRAEGWLKEQKEKKS